MGSVPMVGKRGLYLLLIALSCVTWVQGSANAALFGESDEFLVLSFFVSLTLLVGLLYFVLLAVVSF